MASYVGRRILWLIPTVFGASVITFLMIHLAPGDPATALLGVKATPRMIAYINHEYGLDRPLPVQYVTWAWQVLHLNLGQSIAMRLPITQLLASRFPVTLQLSVLAMIVSLLIAVPLGIVSAVRKDTFADNFGRAVAFIGISMPSFWLGLLLLLVFAVAWPILPLYGYTSIVTNPIQGLKHLILPAITLGAGLAAIVTRMIRSTMLEAMSNQYIVTARAKGLSERVVIFKHTLRNALIPVVTVIGLQLGFILGGSVLVEVVFALPGLGSLIVNSIFSRDYPVVQGGVLLYAITFIFVNLAVDLTYGLIDPRIRYD